MNTNLLGVKDNRLLFIWTHHIAKGMEYFSQKRVMHGDLAARNVLLTEWDSGNIVAKIADFGLSKRFYDNIIYTKQQRKDVPWKWMAPEYLDKNAFTMNSDVWSFGVVLWELFSLGKEPYPRKSFKEVTADIKQGSFLPYPEVHYAYVPRWNLETTYKRIAQRCFHLNPFQRSTFTELVHILNAEMKDYEKKVYEKLLQQIQTQNCA